MRNPLLKTSFAALAVVVLSTTVHAATLTYTADDLFLGFRSTAAGVTNDIEIDLGPASTFKNASAPFTLSIGAIGTDLTNQFGASWFNSANVYWGIVGTPGAATANGDPANLLYASHPASGTAAYTRASAATQGQVRNDFNTAEAQYNGATANGVNAAVLVQSTGAAFSWASYNPGGQSFSYFTGLENSFANGAAGASLDLDRIQAGSGSATDIGTFSINNSGAITFSPVPEPGSCALLGFGGLALGFYRRRQALQA